MRRLFAAISTLAIGVVLLLAGSRFLVGESAADLENQVFTSRSDRIRIVIPRGWRGTDQPSYPGLALWMMRSQPPGRIVLTSEAFTRELYCSWPIACRTSHESPASKYACALRQKLTAQRFRVGPVQPGPKDNEASGLPSVWFEYDDGKTFLRQAIALGVSDRAVSLVLSAPSNDIRATHVRAFEQALRTLRTVSAEEAATSTLAPDAAVPLAIVDGPVADAAPLSDAVEPGDAGVTFESAPAPREVPIGPCP
ncbi:MAG: hypothetical protein JNL83_37860 [Myxococcales bacterium]|nr:hypothetical protein [Myxococcales bacterium]